MHDRRLAPIVSAALIFGACSAEQRSLRVLPDSIEESAWAAEELIVLGLEANDYLTNEAGELRIVPDLRVRFGDRGAMVLEATGAHIRTRLMGPLEPGAHDLTVRARGTDRVAQDALRVWSSAGDGGAGDGGGEQADGAVEVADCRDCASLDCDGDGVAATSCGGDDCDDANPEVQPGAGEGPGGDASCADGLDNDCDGLVDERGPRCGCVHPVVEERCEGEWCRIPAGCFVAGSPGSETCRTADEDQGSVGLTHDFEIGRTEVTQAGYEGLMEGNPARFRSCGPDCPVERVSWHEAAAYCNALSRSLGLEACYSCDGAGGSLRCAQSGAYPEAAFYDCAGYRLPTEAEWEYAARAGAAGATDAGDVTDCRTDPALDAFAWYWSNSGSETHPACSLAPNAWGLCDVLGNVGEWTHDEFVANRGTDPSTDPIFEPAGKATVRGGSWFDFASQERFADRYYHGPEGQSFDTWGFRCARTLDP